MDTEHRSPEMQLFDSFEVQAQLFCLLCKSIHCQATLISHLLPKSERINLQNSTMRSHIEGFKLVSLNQLNHKRTRNIQEVRNSSLITGRKTPVIHA